VEDEIAKTLRQSEPRSRSTRREERTTTRRRGGGGGERGRGGGGGADKTDFLSVVAFCEWRLQRAVDGSLGTAHDKLASVSG